jgi:outer membrane lipoprotein-sorting protein
MSRWLLVSAAVVLALAPASAQESAEAVVKKGIEAHGGAEVLKKLTAGESTYKGDMTVFGMDLEFTAKAIYQLPDKFRMEIDTEAGGMKLAIVQVVNGTKTKSSLNGMATPLGEAEQKELRQAAMLQEVSQLTPLIDSKTYTIKLEKPTDDASVVLVTAKDLNDTKLFFDKKTGLLTKTERKGLAPSMGEPMEVTEETVMSDFKKFDGMMLPTKMTVNHDGKKFMTMTLTDAKLMEKAEAKAFAVDD